MFVLLGTLKCSPMVGHLPMQTERQWSFAARGVAWRVCMVDDPGVNSRIDRHLLLGDDVGNEARDHGRPHHQDERRIPRPICEAQE